VGAFFVLRPSDDEEGSAAPPTASQSEEPADAPAQGNGGGGDGGRSDEEAPAPAPEAPEIELEDGQPIGGVETIEAESGETIEFVVSSDAPDELHVHGFEITEQVAPGEPARFRFPADIEGVYEVEAHEAGDVPVAEIQVSP
jgi:heme/copper-type cytochrome/quinol oxidase subunit 2